MSVWIPIAVQWLVVVGFYAFLFLQGPKGKFARMRCAMHGNHFWSVKTIPEQQENSITLTIEFECTRCKENLKARLEISPEMAVPLVGPTNN
jgi:hypothetical protein